MNDETFGVSDDVGDLNDGKFMFNFALHTFFKRNQVGPLGDTEIII